jgi:hypothetical protein
MGIPHADFEENVPNDLLVQQDRVTPHFHIAVQEVLRSKVSMEMDWPPCS